MSRQILSVVAGVVLVVTTQMAESPLREALWWLAIGYITFDFALQARAGYLRRRPHWTAESWRRFRKACAIPVGGFAVMVAIMMALEWRLPFVGEPRSALRLFWASAVILFMLIGAFGLVAVINWLTAGEASQQFVLPRWLSRGRSDAV